MALKVYARHGGAVSASQDDITARIPFLDGVEGTPIVQMGMGVQNGGASQGTLLVPDPTANDDASLYFPPHTQVTLTEDATGDELMLAQGRISSYSIGRAPGSEVEDAVEWILTVDDANVDLRGLAFTEDWLRPAETGYARLVALAAYTLNGTSSTRADYAGKITYRPSTTIVVDTAHLAPDSNSATMPAKTYPAGTQPQDVANDCATTEGKVYGVVPHHVGGASHLCLEYIKESDHATYASAAKISSELGDWDPDNLTTPVWEPIWDQGKGQVVDGNANISGLVSRYGTDSQVVISVDETFGDANEYWNDSYQDGDSVDASQAASRAASIIAYRSPFSESDRCSVEILPEQHALITAGMSIQVKAPPINAGTVSTVGTYVDRRIVSLVWEPRANGKLHAILQLNRPTRAPSGGKIQAAATTPRYAPVCGIDGCDWRDDMVDAWGSPMGAAWIEDDQGYGVSAGATGNGTEGLLEQLPHGSGPIFYDSPKMDWDPGFDALSANAFQIRMKWRIVQLGNRSTFAMYAQSDATILGAYMHHNIESITATGYNVRGPNVTGDFSTALFTYAEDVPYYSQFRMGQGYAQGKVWAVGDPEPGFNAWSISTSSSSAVPVLGFNVFQNANDGPESASIIAIDWVCIWTPGTDCVDASGGDSPYWARSDDPRFIDDFVAQTKWGSD